MPIARLFEVDHADLVEHYPNRAEHAADGIVHAVGLALAAIGGALLIVFSWLKGGPGQAIPPALYAICLLAMLSASAAYNLTRPNRARRLLRTLDEAAIFLMIAGSYTPFTVAQLDGWWSVVMTGLVWALALAGVAGKLFLHTLSERFWCGVYIAFGWLSIVMMVPLASALPWPVLALLAAGGLVYTGGVAFFLHPTLPFRRAVWHGFVVAGAGAHYLAVLATVMIG